MKNLILIIALITTTLSFTSAQDGNKIIVMVDQIESSEGKIKVSIFNSEQEFLGKPFLRKSKDASIGQLRFEFDEVPNGEYTISIYHDENSNGEFDKNFIGIPNEPYGISLDGKSRFGPPSYEDAKFTLLNESTSLIISLK